MSTHNIYFCVEIRKYQYFMEKKNKNNTIPRTITFMQFDQGLHYMLAEKE